MKLRRSDSTFLAGSAAVVGAGSASPQFAFAADRNVLLKASDGVRIYGVERDPAAKPVGVILLFHQASSSADEYDPIAPKLVALGYGTLAIDQRSGGGLYGRNRTVAEIGQSQSFIAAARDLDAAIGWARVKYPQLPLTLWGSSYSASLVFMTAANHPGKIARVVAFSPDEYFSEEYFEGKPVVANAAKRVTVPIFVDSAANHDEIEAAKTILAASPSNVKVHYVPKHGVHGSSTLRKDKDPDGYDENWRAVIAFLAASPSAVARSRR